MITGTIVQRSDHIAITLPGILVESHPTLPGHLPIDLRNQQGETRLIGFARFLTVTQTPQRVIATSSMVIMVS
jgi:hypothetical protein